MGARAQFWWGMHTVNRLLLTKWYKRVFQCTCWIVWLHDELSGAAFLRSWLSPSLSINFLPLVEPEVSLLSLQEFITSPYSEPHKFSQSRHIVFLHFNNILPVTYASLRHLIFVGNIILAGVLIMAEHEHFLFRHRVQTCSWAHPAFCRVGTGGSLPGSKSDVVTTSCRLVQRLITRGAVPSPTPTF